jgi:hypothetical protein
LWKREQDPSLGVWTARDLLSLSVVFAVVGAPETAKITTLHKTKNKNKIRQARVLENGERELRKIE